MPIIHRVSSPPQVLLLCVLTLIPLPPGPSSLLRLTCCRDNSRIVRKIVQSKFLPVLEKHNVKLGMECPFHPDRELFAPQQTAKQQDRPSQWTCTLCGKSFYEEKFLDLHFEHRHQERINTAEDAVCLSNYCDIMRCDVLAAFEGTLFGSRGTSTDIEVWNERTAVATTTTTSKSSARREASPILKATATSNQEGTTRSSGSSSSSLNNKSHQSGRGEDLQSSATCDRKSRKSKEEKKASIDGSEEEEEDDDEDVEGDEGDRNQSCVKEEKEPVAPPLDRKQQRIVDMQRMKANCKKEELDKLRAKCQILIRDCIGGLLVNLSTQEFKEMEGE